MRCQNFRQSVRLSDFLCPRAASRLSRRPEMVIATSDAILRKTVPMTRSDHFLNPITLNGPNPQGFRATVSDTGMRAARAVIFTWLGYAPTPLVDLPGQAERLGVGRIRIKDESRRFGLKSFKALGGALDTIMAGLVCGEPSLIAWPILSAGVTSFQTIPDSAAAEMMRLLASGHAGARLTIGESGVAGVAGLVAVARDSDLRAKLDLDLTSGVLVFGSEGDTDAALYKRLISKETAL